MIVKNSVLYAMELSLNIHCIINDDEHLSGDVFYDDNYVYGRFSEFTFELDNLPNILEYYENDIYNKFDLEFVDQKIVGANIFELKFKIK